MNRAIGGYFGLETGSGNEFHTDGLRLNTGRNALEYLLISKNIEKLFIPLYTCDVLMEPIKKVGVDFEFYNIDENFEAVFEFDKIQKKDYFLYTNYFGLKGKYILTLAEKCNNLIIDNAQAFYNKPIKGTHSFYSARKFFGVPDGAYLYTDSMLDIDFETDISYQRFEHLLRRIDISAENGYSYFLNNELLLNNLPIMKMSNLTRRILNSVNYEQVAMVRLDNFKYLDENLGNINRLSFSIGNNDIPMVYPFYSIDNRLRAKLIENKVYTPIYWPNVLNWTTDNSVERDYTQNIIHLPIDQRIGKAELDRILDIILN